MIEQSDIFYNKLRQWEELLAKDKKHADDYYWGNLFEDVIEQFLSRSKELKRYRFLISPVGFSAQPIILFIKAIRPERILFIFSEDTEHQINFIAKWTGITFAQVDKEHVDSSDVTGVYKAIKQFVAGKNPGEILIDITGGKKSMVGGAVMAGNFLGIDTGYVDYDEYIPDLRQPKPGTEYPNILKNPLTVFGDIELNKAKEAFNQYNFARVVEIASFLEEKIEDIWEVKIIQKLNGLYQELDAFNFNNALILANEFIEKYVHFVDKPRLEKVRKTSEILQALIDQKHPNHGSYMGLNLFHSGERFAERNRYDVAVFLMYRVIELVLSFSLRAKGIDVSNPTYPKEITEARYNQKLAEIFEKEYREKTLPGKIGLMDSAIFLSLLHDPVVVELDIRKLKSIINLRNESIFTHGTRPLCQDDYRKIRRVAIKLLDRYLNSNGKPNTVDFKDIFSFPKL